MDYTFPQKVSEKMREINMIADQLKELADIPNKDSVIESIKNQQNEINDSSLLNLDILKKTYDIAIQQITNRQLCDNIYGTPHYNFPGYIEYLINEPIIIGDTINTLTQKDLKLLKQSFADELDTLNDPEIINKITTLTDKIKNIMYPITIIDYIVKYKEIFIIKISLIEEQFYINLFDDKFNPMLDFSHQISTVHSNYYDFWVYDKEIKYPYKDIVRNYFNNIIKNYTLYQSLIKTIDKSSKTITIPELYIKERKQLETIIMINKFQNIINYNIKLLSVFKMKYNNSFNVCKELNGITELRKNIYENITASESDLSVDEMFTSIPLNKNILAVFGYLTGFTPEVDESIPISIKIIQLVENIVEMLYISIKIFISSNFVSHYLVNKNNQEMDTSYDEYSENFFIDSIYALLPKDIYIYHEGNRKIDINKINFNENIMTVFDTFDKLRVFIDKTRDLLIYEYDKTILGNNKEETEDGAVSRDLSYIYDSVLQYSSYSSTAAHSYPDYSSTSAYSSTAAYSNPTFSSTATYSNQTYSSNLYGDDDELFGRQPAEPVRPAEPVLPVETAEQSEILNNGKLTVELLENILLSIYKEVDGKYNNIHSILSNFDETYEVDTSIKKLDDIRKILSITLSKLYKTLEQKKNKDGLDGSIYEYKYINSDNISELYDAIINNVYLSYNRIYVKHLTKYLNNILSTEQDDIIQNNEYNLTKEMRIAKIIEIDHEFNRIYREIVNDPLITVHNNLINMYNLSEKNKDGKFYDILTKEVIQFCKPLFIYKDELNELNVYTKENNGIINYESENKDNIHKKLLLLYDNLIIIRNKFIVKTSDVPINKITFENNKMILNSNQMNELSVLLYNKYADLMFFVDNILKGTNKFILIGEIDAISIPNDRYDPSEPDPAYTKIVDVFKKKMEESMIQYRNYNKKIIKLFLRTYEKNRIELKRFGMDHHIDLAYPINKDDFVFNKLIELRQHLQTQKNITSLRTIKDILSDTGKTFNQSIIYNETLNKFRTEPIFQFEYHLLDIPPEKRTSENIQQSRIKMLDSMKQDLSNPFLNTYSLHILIDGLIGNVGSRQRLVMKDIALDGLKQYYAEEDNKFKLLLSIYFIEGLLIEEFTEFIRRIFTNYKSSTINKKRSLIRIIEQSKRIIDKQYIPIMGQPRMRVGAIHHSQKKEPLRSQHPLPPVRPPQPPRDTNIEDYDTVARIDNIINIQDDDSYKYPIAGIFLVGFLMNNTKVFNDFSYVGTIEYENHIGETISKEITSYDSINNEIIGELFNNDDHGTDYYKLLKYLATRSKISEIKSSLIDELNKNISPDENKFNIFRNSNYMPFNVYNHALGGLFSFSSESAASIDDSKDNIINNFSTYKLNYILLNSGAGAFHPLHNGSLSVEVSSTASNFNKGSVVDVLNNILRKATNKTEVNDFYNHFNEKINETDLFMKDIVGKITLIDREYNIQNNNLYGDLQVTGTCTMHASLMAIMILGIKGNVSDELFNFFNIAKQDRIDHLLEYYVSVKYPNMQMVNYLYSLKLKGHNIYNIDLDNIAKEFDRYPTKSLDIESAFDKYSAPIQYQETINIYDDISTFDKLKKNHLLIISHTNNAIYNSTIPLIENKLFSLVLEQDIGSDLFFDTSKYNYILAEQMYRNIDDTDIVQTSLSNNINTMYFIIVLNAYMRDIGHSGINHFPDLFIDEISDEFKKYDFANIVRNENNNSKINKFNKFMFILCKQCDNYYTDLSANSMIKTLLRNIDYSKIKIPDVIEAKDINDLFIGLKYKNENADSDEYSDEDSDEDTYSNTANIILNNVKLTNVGSRDFTLTFNALYNENNIEYTYVINDDNIELVLPFLFKYGDDVLFTLLKFFFKLNKSSNMIHECKAYSFNIYGSDDIFAKNITDSFEKNENNYDMSVNKFKENKYIWLINLFNNDTIDNIDNILDNEYELFVRGLLHNTQSIDIEDNVTIRDRFIGNAQTNKLKELVDINSFSYKANNIEKCNELQTICFLYLSILLDIQYDVSTKSALLDRLMEYTKSNNQLHILITFLISIMYENINPGIFTNNRVLLNNVLIQDINPFIHLIIQKKSLTKLIDMCKSPSTDKMIYVDNLIKLGIITNNNSVYKWKENEVDIVFDSGYTRDMVILKRKSDDKYIITTKSDQSLYFTDFEFNGAKQYNSLLIKKESNSFWDNHKIGHNINNLCEFSEFIFYKENNIIYGYDTLNKRTIELNIITSDIKIDNHELLIENVNYMDQIMSYGLHTLPTTNGIILVNQHRSDSSINTLANLKKTYNINTKDIDELYDKTNNDIIKQNIRNPYYIIIKHSSDYMTIFNDDIEELLLILDYANDNGNPFLLNIVIRKLVKICGIPNMIVKAIDKISFDKIDKTTKYKLNSFIGIFASLASQSQFNAQTPFSNKIANIHALLSVFKDGTIIDQYFRDINPNTRILKKINDPYDFKLLDLLKEIFLQFIEININKDLSDNVDENKYKETQIICSLKKQDDQYSTTQLLHGIPNTLIISLKNEYYSRIGINIFKSQMTGHGYLDGILDTLNLSQKALELNSLLIASEKLQQINLTYINCQALYEIYQLINKNNLVVDSNKTQLIALFEHMFGYIIKKQQFEFFVKIIQPSENDYHSVNQLLMGLGKTSVITPLLLLYNRLNLEFKYQLNSNGEIDTVEITKPTQKIILSLPEHLMHQTNNMISNKYYYLIGKYNYYYNLSYSNAELILRHPDNNLRLGNFSIIDDVSLKLLYLVSRIKSIQFNITDYLLIIDEFDLQYQPLSSELNIPNPTEQKEPLIYGDILIDFVFEITEKYAEKVNMGELKEEDINDNNKREKYVMDIINESDFMRKNKSEYIDNASTSDEILRYGFIKRCIHYLVELTGLYYRKDYGYSPEKNVFIGIPYTAVNKPATGSRFSNILMTLVVTCLTLSFGDIHKSKKANIFNKVYNYMKAMIQFSSIEVLKKINPIESYVSIAVIINSFDEATSIFNSSDNVLTDKDLKLWLLKGPILEHELTTIKNQYNTSFMDIIDSSFTNNKIGFSGTIKIDLPQYDDDNKKHTIQRLNDDSYSIGAVNTAIKGIPEFPTYIYKINELTEIFTTMYNMNMNVLIDAGAFFKKYNIEEIIEMMMNQFSEFDKDVEEAFKKKLNERYVIFSDNNNSLMVYYNGTYTKYTGELYNNDELILVYDHKHIVGTDIPQPFGLNGLCTLTKQNRFTDISQAIFRIRKLGYGATINFIHYNYTYSELYEYEVTKRNEILLNILNINEEQYLRNGRITYLSQNIRTLLRSHVNKSPTFNSLIFKQKVFLEEYKTKEDSMTTILRNYINENTCKPKYITNRASVLYSLCRELSELINTSGPVMEYSVIREEEHEDVQEHVENIEIERENETVMEQFTTVNAYDPFNVVYSIVPYNDTINKDKLFMLNNDVSTEKKYNITYKSELANWRYYSLPQKFNDIVFTEEIPLSVIPDMFNAMSDENSMRLILSPNIYEDLFGPIKDDAPYFYSDDYFYRHIEYLTKKYAIVPIKQIEQYNASGNINIFIIQIKDTSGDKDKFMILSGNELNTLLFNNNPEIEIVNVFNINGKSLFQSIDKKNETLPNDIMGFIAFTFKIKNDLYELIKFMNAFPDSYNYLRFYLSDPFINKIIHVFGGKYDINNILESKLKELNYDRHNLYNYLQSGEDRFDFIRNIYNMPTMSDESLTKIVEHLVDAFDN